MRNVREILVEIRRSIQLKLEGNTAQVPLDEIATNDEYRIWADIENLLEVPASRFAAEAFATLLHRPPEHDELIRVEKSLDDPFQFRAAILIELCSSEEASLQGLAPVASFLSRMLHRLKPAWRPAYLEILEGEDFVRALYRTILGRSVGTDFPLWLDLLQKGFLTKESMLSLFLSLADHERQSSGYLA